MFKIEFLGSASEVRREMSILLGLQTGPISSAFSGQEICTHDNPVTVVSESGDSFGESSPVPDEPSKPARKRRTKAQIEADEAAEKASSTAEPEAKEDEPAPEPLKEVKPPEVKESEGTEITEQILRAACIKAQDRLGGPEPVLALLKEYGSTNVAGVKADDRKAVYDLVSKLGVVEEKKSF